MTGRFGVLGKSLYRGLFKRKMFPNQDKSKNNARKILSEIPVGYFQERPYEGGGLGQVPAVLPGLIF